MTIDRTAEVKQQISEAFSDVPYPGDTVADLARASSVNDDINIADAFRGKHWREMPIEVLLSNHFIAESLPHMTLKAFHFYLPGFMLATLDRRGTHLADSTLLSLAPPQLSSEIKDFPGASQDAVRQIRDILKRNDVHIPLLKKEYEERMSLLSLTQKKAVLAFLNLLKQDGAIGWPPNGIDRAIECLSRAK